MIDRLTCGLTSLDILANQVYSIFIYVRLAKLQVAKYASWFCPPAGWQQRLGTIARHVALLVCTRQATVLRLFGPKHFGSRNLTLWLWHIPAGLGTSFRFTHEVCLNRSIHPHARDMRE